MTVVSVVEFQGWDWNFVHGEAHRAECIGVAENFICRASRTVYLECTPDSFAQLPTFFQNHYLGGERSIFWTTFF